MPDYTAPPNIAGHPAWARLETQRAYYSDTAVLYQDRYKKIKLFLIAISASLPLLAFIEGSLARYVVAGVGVMIAVLEGVLLLNQYGTLWVKYRGTAESLKRERWLLLSGAGEYKGLEPEDALRLLAERVEALLEVEHREWTESQKQALEQLAHTHDWAQARRDALAKAIAAAAQPGGAAPAVAPPAVGAGAPPAAAAVPPGAGAPADAPEDAPADATADAPPGAPPAAPPDVPLDAQPDAPAEPPPEAPPAAPPAAPPEAPPTEGTPPRGPSTPKS